MSVVSVGLRTVLMHCQPNHRVTKMLISLQMSASSFTDVQFMKAFYVHNERCIATVVVKEMNFPRNIRSWERMVQGTNSPGNESSRERMVQGTNVPVNEWS